MTILPQLRATEMRLLREADSLGEVLEKLRDHIPPVLIAGSGWENLLACARRLPPTMAAFPFGFELRLHKLSPQADLGIPLVSGSQSAALFKERMRHKEGDPAIAGILRLIGEKGDEQSPLHRITGPKMMLEYDVNDRGATGDGHRDVPGVFLYPTETPLFGRDANRRLADLAVVLDGIANIGWDWDPAERGHVEQVYLALPPEARILSIGAFPSRQRCIRLTVTDFKTVRDVVTFLERVKWPGQCSTVKSTLTRLELRSAFGSISIHLDVQTNGLGPKLGLGLFAKNIDWLKEGRYWMDDPSNRTAFIEAMKEEPMIVPQKLSALAGWSSGEQHLYGKTGPLVLIRGVHHAKLTVKEGRLEQIKAYVYMLIGAK